MSNKWQRYEVILPFRLDDGSWIPSGWFSELWTELSEHWRLGPMSYSDSRVRFCVDVPDNTKSRAWMKKCKTRWKGRLGQRELGMVSYPIEVE
jgi:hypothetical protein